MSDWQRQARVMELCSRAHLLWKRYLERELQAHGVSIKQVYLLHRLAEAGSLGPAEIADELFCDRPTATSLLDTLQRRGWIARESDPADGRRRRVVLTAASRRKRRSLPATASRAVPQDVDPLAPLSTRAAADLERALDRLVRHLEAETGG